MEPTGNKKALYFDCSSGISGDMAVAALLDLGADAALLTDTLRSLPLSGYRIEIKEVAKSGISASDFAVILDKAHENHDHDMAYLHALSGHGVDAIHGTAHAHAADAADVPHDTPHTHRNLEDIRHILAGGNLTPQALSLAQKIFLILAEAEAKAHNLPIDKVHFHEVGAVDSIVDIAAFAICFTQLGYEDVILPMLCDGTGTIRCQHGELPIPVPAVINIIQAHHLPLSILPARGEFVTPTGAAIAAAVRTKSQLPDVFFIDQVGIGAGKRTYEIPGLLRIMKISF